MAAAKHRRSRARRSAGGGPMVARWGNSLALRIPQAVGNELGLREGTKVKLQVEGRKLVIEPAEGIPTLDELLEGATPENAGGELWRRPVGKELL